MNQIPFEDLVEMANKAYLSDYFRVAPAWARRHINEFLANDCVISRENRSGRYNLVRAIREVEATNAKLERDNNTERVVKTRITGKTARTKAAKKEYRCPCVTKEGLATGHSSKSSHDSAIRSKMRSAKGGK